MITAAAVLAPVGEPLPSGRTLKELIDDFQIDGINNNLTMLLSLALILFGIVMVFTGYGFLKLNVFFIGFLLCSWLALDLLLLIDSEMMFDQDWILLLIMFVGGVLGGMVAVKYLQFAPVLFGAAVGWFFANLFFSTPWASTANQFLKVFVIICFVLIGVGIGSSWGERILIYGVVFFGAFAIFTGLDYFVHSGFNRIYFAALRSESIESSRDLWLMIVGFFVVTIVGAMIQSGQTLKSSTRDAEVV